MLVFRTVIVDGDLDVVLLDVLLKHRQGLGCRRTNDQRKASSLRILELAFDVVLVSLLKADVSASDQLHAGIGEFFLRRIDLFGRAVQLQVEVFDVQIRSAQLLQHLNGLFPAELPEGIRCDTKLDIGAPDAILLSPEQPAGTRPRRLALRVSPQASFVCLSGDQT